MFVVLFVITHLLHDNFECKLHLHIPKQTLLPYKSNPNEIEFNSVSQYLRPCLDFTVSSRSIGTSCNISTTLSTIYLGRKFSYQQLLQKCFIMKLLSKVHLSNKITNMQRTSAKEHARTDL